MRGVDNPVTEAMTGTDDGTNPDDLGEFIFQISFVHIANKLSSPCRNDSCRCSINISDSIAVSIYKNGARSSSVLFLYFLRSTGKKKKKI